MSYRELYSVLPDGRSWCVVAGAELGTRLTPAIARRCMQLETGSAFHCGIVKEAAHYEDDQRIFRITKHDVKAMDPLSDE